MIQTKTGRIVRPVFVSTEAIVRVRKTADVVRPDQRR